MQNNHILIFTPGEVPAQLNGLVDGIYDCVQAEGWRCYKDDVSVVTSAHIIISDAEPVESERPLASLDSILQVSQFLTAKRSAVLLLTAQVWLNRDHSGHSHYSLCCC